MKCAISMGVQIESVRLPELRQQDERGKGIEMLVERLAAPGHLQWKGSIGL